MASLSSRKRPLSPRVVNGSPEKRSGMKHDFTCPICFDLMEEPHVTKCGHTYCFQCISQSLERKKSCPKCMSPVDAVFPNFLLNELITKHRQALQDRKEDVSRLSAPGSQTRQVNEIQELLDQKADQLAIADLNYLILSLRRKKRSMEQTSAYVQNELLKEFLAQARKHKQDELDQVTRELNQIEKDIKRADELSAVIVSSPVTAMAVSSCSSDQLIKSSQAQESMKGSNCTVHLAADTILQPDQQPSSSNGLLADENLVQDSDIQSASSSPVTPGLLDSRQYSLSEKKIKMIAYFDTLESCYLSARSQSLTFPAPTAAPAMASTSSSSSLTRSAAATYESRFDGDDYSGLTDFSSTLNQFTSYNGLRPLATLCYTSDLFSGSSIVSSIEFDKENEYFAIAGVTKKIKLFDYSSVISSNGSNTQNDMHYPLVEMECNSKISCVSWSSYIKSMMASSDYEGSVIVWDAFTAQKLRVMQEHEKRCWSVDFNKIDTKLVASGSDDAKVKLWSTHTPHSVATLEAKANVCCVKFNPSKRYHLAFGSADHCVHYYDLRNTKSAISVFKGHGKAVSYVKFLSESQLVSASTDSQLKLWSLTENRCVKSFKGHINEKNFVGLATSGDFIACGSENNSLYVYFRGVPRHMLSFHFDSPPASASVNKILGPDGKGKKEEDTSDFVSAVSWRTGTNVIAAANSQGMIKILELI